MRTSVGYGDFDSVVLEPEVTTVSVPGRASRQRPPRARTSQGETDASSCSEQLWRLIDQAAANCLAVAGGDKHNRDIVCHGLDRSGDGRNDGARADPGDGRVLPV